MCEFTLLIPSFRPIKSEFRIYWVVRDFSGIFVIIILQAI